MCIIEFMNPKVKFSEMTRLQRISCIKVTSVLHGPMLTVPARA